MIKDLILEYVNNNEYQPLTFQELAKQINLNRPDLTIDEINKNIVELENEHDLIRVKKDKLVGLKFLRLAKGQLQIKRKGFGFVRCDGFDVFVAKDDLNGAINKDYVLVQYQKSKNKDEYDGKIYKIIKEGYEYIVGSVEIIKDQILVIPDDKNLDFKIKINPKNSLNASEGHKVLCVISGRDTKKNIIFGEITDIIGHINDVGIDILSIVYQHGFNPDFSPEALEEAENIKQDDIKLGKRTDLRDKKMITIDGADAKDLDDAVYLEINEKGNRVLYVSIADVSYYVTPGTALDKEAYQRGTSVYLVDRVVPMIPHHISNGICSLLPNVDRLTQTCKMEFDNKGNVIDYQIFESIINSKYRLTYDEVNQVFDNNQETKEKYHEIVKMLEDMLGLSLQLRALKTKRGMLDFEVPEPKIEVDKNGKVIDIHLRERFDAEKLIEDFMIIANETVAQHIFWLELPFLYRVHESPNPEKVRDFLKFASIFNLKLKGSLEHITSKDIQRLLDQINEDHTLWFLDGILLRTMAKAVYQRECIGHFGLASKYYTHFTSPIRRYPDLIVHRYLRKYLYEKDLPKNKEYSKLEQLMDQFGEKTSAKERDAIEAERDVNDLKMAEYMSDKIGNVYEGVISSVMSFGFFVELDNTVEGLVHASVLDDDYYVFHGEYHVLIGERTGRKFQLGQRIKIKVESVDVASRSIDFSVFSKKSKKHTSAPKRGYRDKNKNIKKKR